MCGVWAHGVCRCGCVCVWGCVGGVCGVCGGCRCVCVSEWGVWRFVGVYVYLFSVPCNVFFLILDIEDPIVLACPVNQTRNTAPGIATAVAVWADPQATDNSGITPNVTCSVESGSQFQIGQTEVVCEARDPSGNQADCTFIIEVIGKYEYIKLPVKLLLKLQLVLTLLQTQNSNFIYLLCFLGIQSTWNIISTKWFQQNFI